jgi:hypothetical protein
MLPEKKLSKLPEPKKEPGKAELTDRELDTIAGGGKGGGGGTQPAHSSGHHHYPSHYHR